MKSPKHTNAKISKKKESNLGQRPPFHLPAFVHCKQKGDIPLEYSNQFRKDFPALNGQEGDVREGITTFADEFTEVSRCSKTYDISSRRLKIKSLRGKKVTTVARGVHLVWKLADGRVYVLRVLPESKLYEG